MCKWIIVTACLFQVLLLHAQQQTLPEEATSFLVKGYELLDYITGDLNEDKKADAILILKQPGEDTTYDDSKRPFIILIRQQDGKLKQVKRNDEIVMCRQCGGVIGDPYQPVQIKDNGFELQFFGGSAMKWSFNYFFRYNPAKSNWFLYKEYQENYNSLKPEKDHKEVTITAEELGQVSIDSFNSNMGYTESNWKVVATKTFFYNEPLVGSKPRKAYLLKGDMIHGIREFTNFVSIYYTGKNDRSSYGFILKKDLLKTK